MSLRVLAVDDDPFVLTVLERYLGPEGMDVVGVGSGEAALARIAAGDIGLVILDVNLPQMSGLEVCRRIKESERTREVPVILLTAARVDGQSQERGFEVGADAYMAKPLLRRALLRNIAAVLAE